MNALKHIINKFPKAKVLVVGDLILDEYIIGEVDRISPEAPVPVVWAKKRSFVPGGAANVANNIAALAGKVCLLGVIGKDRNAQHLTAELKKRSIDTRGIFIDPSRPTTVKTRVTCGHQQMLRLDWEERNFLSEKLNAKIAKFLKDNIGRFDAVIIEDYGKGMINKQLLQELIDLGRSRNKIVTVDPKEDHFQYYKAVTSITPNRKELENAVRNLKIKDTTNNFKVNTDKLFSNSELIKAACEVLRYLDLDSILVTRGEEGMSLFEKHSGSVRVEHIPTVAQQVFDVSGAGDTVIATFTLGLCAGANKLQAAHIANFAAGIVVGKIGTATVTREELINKIGR